MMRQIALYGKGGIGKSTTSANLSAAFAEKGYTVMQIGCDPKRDSTRMLMQGEMIPTVMDEVREHGDREITADEVVFTGYRGISCVEAGGPEPGIGCAGRGIIATFSLLERLNVLAADIIVYDVLGDVVCGGFAMPMRKGYAEEIYLVTSGELMSLYAANNICKAIERLACNTTPRCHLGGIICNARGLLREEELVGEFAEKVGSRLVAFIPRSDIVQEAELNRKTVIEYAPASDQAGRYRFLSEQILNTGDFCIPTPLSMQELEDLGISYRS